MADNRNNTIDLVSDLNSLDFSNYIGGPLQAAVDAQNSAAMAVVNFIKEVGFKNNGTADDPDYSINYVEFSYQKQLDDTHMASYKLSVPLLTIVPIPALRIDEMTIDFNAKLNSVETANVSTNLGVGASVSAGFSKIGFKASASYRRTTTSGSKVEKTYEMNVHVKVVNDEIPAGLDRILRILESEIGTESKTVPNPTSNPEIPDSNTES